MNGSQGCHDLFLPDALKLQELCLEAELPLQRDLPINHPSHPLRRGQRHPAGRRERTQADELSGAECGVSGSFGLGCLWRAPTAPEFNFVDLSQNVLKYSCAGWISAARGCRDWHFRRLESDESVPSCAFVSNSPRVASCGASFCERRSCQSCGCISRPCAEKSAAAFRCLVHGPGSRACQCPSPTHLPATSQWLCWPEQPAPAPGPS